MITDDTKSFSVSSAHDCELAEVLDRYLKSLEDDAPLDVESLVAEHPRIADDIRAFVESVDMLHGAAHGMHGAPQSLADRRSADTVSMKRPAEKRLGDFEIGSEIGRGGMGVVYEATQISLQRKVALKVLPFAAMWDHKQIARFQNEAQAAAQLQHANIVPVFAVGQERGVHFYAMQLIQGRSLDQVLGELRREAGKETPSSEQCLVSTVSMESTVHSELSSEHAAGQSRYCRAIAGLGIQAANALQYAHECGVIHRDVKPSNLLVDHRNKLWITDFGLARVQDSPGVTVTGDVVGTLRYMSPEQAMGNQALVDPRSDIYSLGATLYELLTLRPAFDGDERQAVLHAIGNQEPTPPRAISPAIPLDLETIVLQAMAKSRDERYATAQQFADDLNRFLEGKPTLARRPTLADRASKWVRRHRVVVSLAAVFLLILTIVSTTGAFLLSREHARKQAALEAQQVFLIQARAAVNRFGGQFAQELAKLPGSEPLRMAVLNDTLKYHQEFIKRAADKPDLKGDLASTYFQSGTIAGQLGDQAKSQAAFEKAAELFAELSVTSDQPAEYRQQQAMALNNLALLFAAQGKADEARTRYNTAIKLQSEVAAGDKPPQAAARLLAELYTNRGLLERQNGDAPGARKSLTRAIAQLEKIVAIAPEDDEARYALAMAFNNRSFVEQASHWEAAEQSCRRAVELFEELAATAADNQAISAATRGDLALSYNNLAAIRGHLGKHAEAIAAFRRAVELQEQLVRQAPGVVQFRSDLAITWNNLAQALARQEESHESNQAYDQAQQLFTDLVNDYPRDIRYQSSLAGVLNNRGMARELAGDLDAALAEYRDAIEHQKVAVEQSPQNSQYREFLSKHYVNCGRTLRLMDRHADAAALAIERRKLWSNDGVQLYQIALELSAIAAEMLENQEDPTEALGRDQVIDEAVLTLQQAKVGGYAIEAHDLPPVLRIPYELSSKYAGEVEP
jgi:serine/threonine protein kinase/tetratricopeptide (TPR) repeat protein